MMTQVWRGRHMQEVATPAGDGCWYHIPAAIIVAAREETLTVLEETLQDWRVTVGQLADPLRRAILLGEHQEEDFVEVARPGPPTA